MAVSPLHFTISDHVFSCRITFLIKALSDIFRISLLSSPQDLSQGQASHAPVSTLPHVFQEPSSNISSIVTGEVFSCQMAQFP